MADEIANKRAENGAHQKGREVVYVRYLDHVLFKDAGLDAYRPFVREAVGWLDHEDDGFIRLVWERFAEPTPSGELKQRATGLVILKSAILVMRKFDGENYLHQRARRGVEA
jgi:hypothetical protein